MAIEEGLYTYLSASTAITALVSDRIYPSARPQGESYPAITFERITSQHPHHMTAAACRAMASIQIDCWAKGAGGYSEAAGVAEAVRNRLDGYRGAMGSEEVKTCHLTQTNDDYFPPTDAARLGTHRVSMDFSIWFVEDEPTFS